MTPTEQFDHIGGIAERWTINACAIAAPIWCAAWAVRATTLTETAAALILLCLAILANAIWWTR